ncbi:extracellular solute-binding protein [Cryobacterium breve]|uniref:Extracellular solute-binding protein n=1 Tax=Cryobacterium breve TaxID=1259258 RepID=A0ABY7NCB2_9MICO|nr:MULTISPECIES: extracellular solute-binding protein [Cryobacterium]MDY7543374.1 extracellular solute-binding protein [Cryobacterium sp. 5B3]MEA9999693.1 extracellular solute-binding protein [Cryobacterium sp. RTS3]MEB0264981.1 extracellular solute-binding protein [Cryobacterium sp. 10I5]MEB0274696.1 extracellular solute-binding protein [Cryobacterium sp. 5B3]WBM79929.1 extracellular solute-binding protein [Cryobacterium breve]
MRHAKKRLFIASLAVASLTLGLAACSSAGASNGDSKSGEITLWTHNAGNKAELDAINAVVKDYNASQTANTVKVQAFPQASYNDSVVAAAAAGKLPCIVDIDGPNVPNWAWAKYLAPLELSADLSKNLPSTLGVWNGATYSFGYYDVALGMFARKSVLAEAGIRIATTDAPWSKSELDSALKTLKAEGKWDNPLDLGTAGSGEWLPYAYSPFLQSFGGDLVDRSDFQSADGVLNGDKAVAWGNWFQGLVKDGYVAAKSGKDSTIDFQNGKSAILYTGSWAADSTRALLGDDLAIMPTVDLGTGPKIGGGSWQWGVTTGCTNKAAAMDYLSFSLQPKYVAAVAKATGTIPATEAAAALIPGYEVGGQLAAFRDYSQKFAVLRPETPAYPFIATEFAKATQDIISGGDVKKSLDDATKAIDANIKSNGGYTQK